MLARLKFEISGLMKEIFNQVDFAIFQSPSSTFLDPAMGGGQFIFETIKRLKEQGHSYDSIKSRVFGYESNILYVNYVRERYFREFGEEIPAVLRVGVLEELESLKMRFDLVMGNPPYTSGTQAANVIWNKFIEKGLDTLTTKGTMAMVVTQSFASSSQYTNLRKRLLQKGLAKVVFLPRETFNIDQTTLYFISQPCDETIVTNGTSYVCHPTDVIFKDKRLASIIEKIEKVQGDGYYKETSYNFRMEDRVRKPCRMATLINGTECVIGEGDCYGEDTEKHRLIAQYFMDDAIFQYRRIWYCPPGVSTGKYRSMVVKNEVEGKVLESLFKSKLFLAIFKGTSSSRTLDGAQMRFLPKLDLSRTWTDQELYEHFNLTDEEIRYIEEQVK